MSLHNTTPVPNWFFSECLPHLSGTEIKALLLIIRNTLGWKDPKTGKRKTRDWIANSLFVKYAGISERSVSTALQSLIDKNLIRATDGDGNKLSHPNQRRHASRIYYSLVNNTVNSIAKNTTRQGISTLPIEKIAEDRPQNLRTTKEIFLQKGSQQGFLSAKQTYKKIKLEQEEERKELKD